jgi:D-arabinose 1-dehydrogenase-like Zn-dependent alcohol dehydrogenase
MQAYELTAFGAPLEATMRDIPEPLGSEVLVRIASSGVCHSDVHLRDGFYELGGGKRLAMPRGVATFPHVLGHEIAGEVAALGPDAHDVALGGRCVVYPWIGCGMCSTCARGDEHLCARPRSLGITAHGGYADYVVVPHPRYLLDIGDVPEDLACTLACSGLTAYSALKKTLPLHPDDRLAIFGAGGVGLAAIGLAERITGCAPIVIELDPGRRRAALAAGAKDAIDLIELAGPSEFVTRCGGRLSAAIDFVGAQATASLAFESLATGGRLVSVGLLGGAFEVPLPMLPLRALTLQGSFVGSLAEMRELIDLARSGAFAPIPIETRPLSAVNASLEDLRAGRITGRIVLKP